MTNNETAGFSKPYLIIVLLLMLVLPILSVVFDYVFHRQTFILIPDITQWFIFWPVGIRLFTAGCKQVLQPAFTAREIFHLKETESFIIVKELGFANICLGIVAICSLFIPEWRMAASCSGGLYFGIAGFSHIIKKPAGANEWIAMVSDMFIFLIMVMCFVFHYL